MKWLVCGGRDQSPGLCSSALNELASIGLPSMVIQWGAQGADKAAGAWATSTGIHVAEVKALWDRHGNAAGHIRNAAMLGLNPDLVVALPGGRGTDSMVSKALKAECAVVRYLDNTWVAYLGNSIYHDPWRTVFSEAGIEVRNV